MVNIMKTLSKILKAFWQEESGLTMTEYAVAGSLITLTAAVAFTNLGAAIVRAINQLIGYMPAMLEDDGVFASSRWNRRELKDRDVELTFQGGVLIIRSPPGFCPRRQMPEIR